MGNVTAEEIARAKEIDLLTYLQRWEPNELVHFSGNTYCTREHDSLKISNGKWHWFSRGIGGKTALDYLIKVRDYSFTQAVETLIGRGAVCRWHTSSADRADRRDPAALPSVFHAPRPEPSRKLLMPELSGSTCAVTRYLVDRGIHPEIIDYCATHRLLFETKRYHNAVFAGYDREGQIRYAALRGTIGNFKGEVTGSDKHYSFPIAAPQGTGCLHLFEAAIDAMSYASFCRMAGRDWQRDDLLSLAGVYQTKRENVVPVALSRYLNDHPHIQAIYLHLDNDEVGRGAAAGILNGLKDSYQVFDQPPKYGKDVNEALQIKMGLHRKKNAPGR